MKMENDSYYIKYHNNLHASVFFAVCERSELRNAVSYSAQHFKNAFRIGTGPVGKLAQ